MTKGNHLIKTRTYRLKPNEKDALLLKKYQAKAASCWNEIVETANCFYRITRRWIGKAELQKWVKGGFDLHSQTIQALTDKYCANRETIALHRKQGNKDARYPYQTKRFLTIPFKLKQNAIKYTIKGTIRLTLSRGVWFDTGFKPKIPINTCEIIWRGNHYVLNYTFDTPGPQSCPIVGTKAGIDIGEIHPAALCAENGKGLIVSGREIRAIKQWRNKALGKLSKLISRCKKGSRKYKRYIRAKTRLKAKTKNQLRDLYHQTTRKVINHCAENNIVELVIGNPKGVEKNTRKAKRLNRKGAQKVSQMEYGRIKQYLSYKAEELGLKVQFEKEHNTSKECPACGKANSCTGRVYKCSCGFIGHRDGKAGFMILRKKYPDLPTPEFSMTHTQCVPKYRKRPKPACVVDFWRGPSRLVKPGLCEAV